MQKLVDHDEVTRRRFLFQGTAAVATGMGLVAGGAVRGGQSQAPEPSSAPVQIPGPICTGLKTEAGEPPPKVSFPNYLESYTDPVYGTRITRITGDAGSPLPAGEGVWQGRTRSIYSIKQVWSADEALLYLHFGGPLILDGETYQVLHRWGPPRMGGWHMTKADTMVYVEGNAVKEWNARTNKSSTVLTLPGYKDLWFWHAEEQMSADGTKMGLGAVRESDGEPVGLAVDLVERERFPVEIPFVAHGFTGGNRGRSAQRAIMSPSGRYLCILGWTHQDPGGKFYGPVRGVGESIRVFDLEGRLVSEDYTVLHCPGHGDMAMGVDGQDYKIGRCDHHREHQSQIVAFACASGEKRAVGGRASSHNSGRCHKRPGWVFASGFGTGSVISASKLDGTRTEYICHTQSRSPVNYWAQTQAVPSPTGSRVCFATNWGIDDADRGNCHSFVADFRHFHSAQWEKHDHETRPDSIDCIRDSGTGSLGCG